MNLELLSHRVLGALFNGGYQGLLLTLAVWAGLKLVPRSNAATRHAVWFVTLLVVAFLPVAHFCGLPGLVAKPGMSLTELLTAEADHQLDAAVPESAGEVRSISTAASPTVYPPLPTMTPTSLPQTPSTTDTTVPAAPVDAFRTPTTVSLTLDGLLEFPVVKPPEENRDAQNFENQNLSAPLPAGNATGAAPKVVSSAGDDWQGDSAVLAGSPFRSRLAGWFAQWQPHLPRDWRLTLPGWAALLLAGTWLLLAAVRLAGLAFQLAQLHLLKRHGTAAPDEVDTAFVALGREMAPGRLTRLLVCPGKGAPMAVGFWRPAVLLPERVLAEAPAEQLQQVLRHELAHVARGDDWANLAQQAVVAALFFHPAVWWLSRRLTVEREIACDDHVLTATRTPRAYALFLTEFASRMRSREVVAAPAAWHHKHQLTERIAMILDPKRNSSPRPGRASVGILSTVTALVAGLALFAGPRLALAGNPDSAPKAADPTEGKEAAEAAEVAEVAVSQDSQDVAVTANTTVVTSVPVSVDFKPATATLVASGYDADSGPRFKAGAAAADPTALPEPPEPPAPGKPHRVAVRVGYAPQPPAPGAVTIVTAPTPSPMPAPAGMPTPAPVPGVHRIILAQNGDAPVEAGNDVFAGEKHGKKEKKEKEAKEGDKSLERRLERLEHQMDELLALQKAKWGAAQKDFQFKFDQNFDQKQFAKAMEDAQRSWPKAEELARMHADMARDQEKMAQDIERAVRESQRAGADAGRAGREEGLKKAKEGVEAEKQAIEMQRKQLEGERHGLEKQMNSLEQQIERLEQAQERIDERAEHEREKLEKHMAEKAEKAQKPAKIENDNSNDDDSSAPRRKEVGR